MPTYNECHTQCINSPTKPVYDACQRDCLYPPPPSGGGPVVTLPFVRAGNQPTCADYAVKPMRFKKMTRDQMEQYKWAMKRYNNCRKRGTLYGMDGFSPLVTIPLSALFGVIVTAVVYKRKTTPAHVAVGAAVGVIVNTLLSRKA